MYLTIDNQPINLCAALDEGDGAFCLEVSRMIYLPRDTVGQGLVEYALILVLVAVVVIAILALLGPALGNIFSNIYENV